MRSFNLALALTLAATAPAVLAQEREPTLIINFDDGGRLHAWLSLTTAMTEPVADAFAQAMGCRAGDIDSWTPRSMSAHVECPAPVKKDDLRWSVRWDFSALNVLLVETGADSLRIHIAHPRSGFSLISPPSLAQSQGVGFNVNYHGELQLAGFHDITIEAGYQAGQIWLLAAVAGAILLLPLLLFAVRKDGPLSVLAGATGLLCLGATAWLQVTLPMNAPGLAPMPLNFVIVSGPLLAAAGIGALIVGGPRRRLLFWRGARAIFFLSLIVGLFSPGQSPIAWLGCGAAGIILCSWRLLRTGGHRVQPLADGELWTRVREIATRAGTHVKSVQLLLGGDDLPAAFATRYRGILISAGLLRALSRREVDAIVGHELSHVRRPRLVGSRGVAFLIPAAVLVGTLVPGSLQWMPLLLPPAFLLHRAMRRRNERLADSDAITWSGDAEAFITGLVRVTRAHGMPIEWPRWVKPLMQHPSTMERVRAVAARAHISEDQLGDLLAASTAPPADCYPIAGSSAGDGSVFTAAARNRLHVRMSLSGLAVSVLFGVAAPFIGYVLAILAGAITVTLACEWMLLRARGIARAALAPGRPGVFAGFSPSTEQRVYDGSYDYDWGFVDFEAERLVFRGDRCSWTVSSHDVQRIWVAPGPFGWMPRPIVCFRTIDGSAFCLRPFDSSFGPAASRAAARLLAQAERWHASAQAAGAAPSTFDFKSVAGQNPPRFTWASVLRSLPRNAAITLVIQSFILLATPQTGWMNPGSFVGPVAVTWILVLFVAYPGIRRGRQTAVATAVPVAQANGPDR